MHSLAAWHARLICIALNFESAMTSRKSFCCFVVKLPVELALTLIL